MKMLGSSLRDLARLRDCKRKRVSSWDETKKLLAIYDVRYVVVGLLEESTYRVNKEKFERYLEPIFQQGGTTIYLVPYSIAQAK